jgi:hypothetical protein
MEKCKRTYEECIALPTFEDRFRYLKLNGSVGRPTFGYARYLNQKFYRSEEWRRFRREIIIRDDGCDLAITDGLHDIRSRILIHHINPITIDDLKLKRLDILLDPNNAICVSHNTHEAIHYSDESILDIYKERTDNDTLLWTPITERS